MKIRPVEAEMFHSNSRTDGWTDRLDEPNSGFCNFANLLTYLLHGAESFLRS